MSQVIQVCGLNVEAAFLCDFSHMSSGQRSRVALSHLKHTTGDSLSGLLSPTGDRCGAWVEGAGERTRCKESAAEIAALAVP